MGGVNDGHIWLSVFQLIQSVLGLEAWKFPAEICLFSSNYVTENFETTDEWTLTQEKTADNQSENQYYSTADSSKRMIMVLKKRSSTPAPLTLLNWAMTTNSRVTAMPGL